MKEKLKYNLQYKKILAEGGVTGYFGNSRYLYLREKSHCQSWVDGGIIPINITDAYKSEHRSGIMTPDEGVIHDSPLDLMSLHPYIRIDNVRGLTIRNSNIGGRHIKSLENASYYSDCGAILSFCRKFDIAIADRLGGKAACVKILDIDKLKNIIDAQLGIVGEVRDCKYTAAHQRSHFLKSVEDMWQEKTRMFWALDRAVNVILPAGIAEVVWERS